MSFILSSYQTKKQPAWKDYKLRNTAQHITAVSLFSVEKLERQNRFSGSDGITGTAKTVVHGEKTQLGEAAAELFITQVFQKGSSILPVRARSCAFSQAVHTEMEALQTCTCLFKPWPSVTKIMPMAYFA